MILHQLIFALGLMSQEPQLELGLAAREPMCTVHLRAINERLREHRYTVARFMNSQGIDLSSQFQESAANVPCGTYSYVVEPFNAPRRATRLRGEIIVRSPGSVLEVQVPRNELVGDDGILLLRDESIPRGPYIKGVVRPFAGSPAKWAVIRSLSEDKREVSKISSTGSFEFSTHLDGLCLLTIESSSGLLHHEILEIRNAANREVLVIELSSEPRPARIVR